MKEDWPAQQNEKYRNEKENNMGLREGIHFAKNKAKWVELIYIADSQGLYRQESGPDTNPEAFPSRCFHWPGIKNNLQIC
jgi:hypothetical protein